MTATIKNGKLIIEIDVQPPRASKAGKNLVIATSHGNHATAAVVDGKPVIIGLNAYIKP